MKNLGKIVSSVIILMVTIACNGGEMKEQVAEKKGKTIRYDSLKDIPDSAWKKFEKKKIFFGHQSVGYNIINGIEDLMKENSNINLNIVEIGDEGTSKIKGEGGWFVHSQVGLNTDPTSKNNDFLKIVSKSLKGDVDIAFFKYCYVDINPSSDLDKIFESYKKMMHEIKAQFPDTLFVHVTVPLTSSSPSGFKAFVKRILGRSSAKPDYNRSRNLYNDKIRKYYGGKEPIFDLAKIESTLPDGANAKFNYKDKQYFEMASAYTSDGGHLNKAGQRLLSEKLLIFLMEKI